MKTESMVNRSMSVVLFAVAIVCAAAAAEPRPGALTALELQEVDGVDLDELLALADASARRYAEVIEDLTTEETTTILTYDDEGRVTERRVFVSQLMVHRSTHSPSPGGGWSIDTFFQSTGGMPGTTKRVCRLWRGSLRLQAPRWRSES